MHQDNVHFREINAASESADVCVFLAAHPWPFHGAASLSLAAAESVSLGPTDEVRAFWIMQNSSKIGLVRLLDLDDVADGSAQFDLRIASEYRGRGIGRFAVSWLTERLFCDYPQLHRIEAATRFDNVAMRRALGSNSYRLEGRLREDWLSADGVRYDTAIYGRLRGDA
jgi:RimJ/RimL family protein N-acetyltransferase